MIPVKICGITRAEDANRAVELGAAALGFIFYPLSPRYITPQRAGAITDAVGARARKVGVFVNASPRDINSIVEEAGLDLVQLSGDEPPEICRDVAVPVIKTFHVDGNFTPQSTHSFDIHAIHLDTGQPGRYGGTGRTFRWSRIQRDAFHRPVILAGGLNPENILSAIEAFNPQAVDVNSGVEVRLGIKDRRKMQRLFTILSPTESIDEPIF